MTITPIQSATQLTIIQTGETRADNNRQRAAGADFTAFHSTGDAEVNNAQNNGGNVMQSGSEKKSNDATNRKKPDFSSLSKSLKDALQLTNVSFEFSFDSQSQSMILRIIDAGTKEVLQQLPSDLALKISRLISGSLEQGQVTDAKV